MLDPYINLIQKYPYSFLMDYCLLASFLSGIMNFRFMDAANRAVFGMVTAILGIELTLIHYAAQGSNNHFLFNITSLVTVASMGVAFSRGAMKASEKRAIWLLVAVYSAVYSAAFQWSRVIEYLLAVERVLLLGFVVLYFRRLTTQMFVSNMLQHAMFWNCVGIILYSASTLYTLLFIRFPFFNAALFQKEYVIYWTLTQWASGLLYLVMGAAFWVRRVEVLKPAL